MFYECVLRFDGCHNDKRVQLMNPNVCHWSQRTLELLKDGTALADLGQALFGTIGDAAVSDSLQNEVNMPAIGYFVLSLLSIKNR
jgi:hypothetical protein